MKKLLSLVTLFGSGIVLCVLPSYVLHKTGLDSVIEKRRLTGFTGPVCPMGQDIIRSSAMYFISGQYRTVIRIEQSALKI